LVFDFSTVFSKAVGSFLYYGASFDPISQLIHGAYFNNEKIIVQTVSYFTFDLKAKKVLYSYTASSNNEMFNYARMGWLCLEVDH